MAVTRKWPTTSDSPPYDERDVLVGGQAESVHVDGVVAASEHTVVVEYGDPRVVDRAGHEAARVGSQHVRDLAGDDLDQCRCWGVSLGHHLGGAEHSLEVAGASGGTALLAVPPQGDLGDDTRR